MKICIFGAGAIGGYLAVELALAGHEVSLVARGRHLLAIQQHGLKLLAQGKEKIARLPATDDARTLGTQDVVICALKAHQAYEAAADFAPLLGPSTAVVTAMNGIPWWYFYRVGNRLEGHHLACVDPGGRQWKVIGPQRAIGCVVDPACHIPTPGVVVHQEFNRFTLGEPDGSLSPRVLALSRALAEAGFDAPVRENIRWNVWLKLWGNVCFNPISALTGATLDRITGDAGLRQLCRTLMLEACAVNEALGVRIPVHMMERRLAAAGSVTGHKMSMLQDLEAGRALEIDALVGAVQELGRLTSVPTPCIDVVLSLVIARAQGLGLYHPLVSS